MPDGDLEPIDNLFARCQESEEVREGYFEKGAAFLLYKVVDHAVDAMFPMLRKSGQKLERLEDDIFEGRSAEIVRDISNIKQEIINFRRIVRPQRVAFRDLERAMDVMTPEKLDVYFDDVIDASERVWDTLENYKEIVEGLESTNESVLSHNVNDTLRVLTSITVIVLPLTLLASVFGMNVAFPGEGSGIAFLFIIIAMFAVLVGMAAFFRLRAGSGQGGPRAAENARDRALVARAIDGDLDAFNELVGLYQDYFHAMTLRVVRERDTAEDVVQEAFYNAYRNLARFSGNVVPLVVDAHRPQCGQRNPAQAQAPAVGAVPGVGGRLMAATGAERGGPRTASHRRASPFRDRDGHGRHHRRSAHCHHPVRRAGLRLQRDRRDDGRIRRDGEIAHPPRQAGAADLLAGDMELLRG